MSATLLRYVAADPERESDRPEGVFAAAYDILHRDVSPAYLQAEIRKTLDWFVRELPIPDRFVSSRKAHRADTGLCWFKSDSVDCIRNVRYLVHLVVECGIPVREIRTNSPGYVIYEDDHQVVAKPTADTPR
ncbi:hypothetical protein Pla22_40820 [Rubripirellula amarantea]|uniref:Uncharacterized protein n=1 Tax=Rubripirellula amarantea TaxID=2527999 RepID=A0A5C5WMA2_9BACT|nr:hypothetical protein [Rubripirellula amarantea]TWT51305.1 hypothetical protein Pla22_40820 [Rubripirellula amarantea]